MGVVSSHKSDPLFVVFHRRFLVSSRLLHLAVFPMASHILIPVLLLAASWPVVSSGPSFKLGGNLLPDLQTEGEVQRRGGLEQRDSVPAGYDAKPYYPAPKGGWDSSWAASYEKARAVVSNMTLAEKVNVTSGVGYLMVSRRCHSGYCLKAFLIIFK